MSYSPTGHIVSGFLNAAVNGINGHLSRKQQERLSEQNQKLQTQMEQSRQDFQRKQSKRTEDFQRKQSKRAEKLQREISLLNIAANEENTRQTLEQQERLFELNRDLQIQIEQNRQDFQLEQSKLNAALQRELSVKNHELRLAEQKANFENLCKQTEWSLFLKSWPLMNLPSVIRSEQILPDRTVSLRVFFARSNDQVFTRAVYPRVEQGLSEFVDLYHNEFQSKNIIFYHNGFSSKVSGGAVTSNIHFALRELPVIIIDSNVLLDEICVSLTMWGFGSAEKSHFTVFKLPYEPHIANGSFSVKYYSELANRLLAHLKFLLGYAYDAYNLIQYNRPPLLPRVAKYEAELGERGCLLDEPEVTNAFWLKYEEIYSMVLGDSAPDGALAFALLPDSFKGCVLHRLRMEYAEAMREYLTDGQFLGYLDDSVKAWAALRTDEPAEDFLRSLADGDKYIPGYADEDDQQYLEILAELYGSVQPETQWGLLVRRINDIQKKTKDIQEDGCPQHYQIKYAEAIREYLTDEQFLRCLDDSVEAWTALHSSEPAEDFLLPAANGRKCATRCIGKDDHCYFEALCALYGSVQKQSPYSLIVKEICVHVTFRMTIDKVYTASCGRNTVEGRVEFGQMKAGEAYEIVGQTDTQESDIVVKCLAASLNECSEDGWIIKCVLEGADVGSVKAGQILMNSNAPSPGLTLDTEAFRMSVIDVDTGNDILEPFGSGRPVVCHAECGQIATGETVEFSGQPDDERRFAVVEITNRKSRICEGSSERCYLHVIGGSIHMKQGLVLEKPGSAPSSHSLPVSSRKTSAQPTSASSFKKWYKSTTAPDPWRQYKPSSSSAQKSAVQPIKQPVSASAPVKQHAPVHGFFRMPVEDVYTLPDGRVVVTGHVERGQLKAGETVEIVGSNNKTITAVALEMFRKLVDHVEAGDNVGIALRSASKANIKRGQVLVKPGSI